MTRLSRLLLFLALLAALGITGFGAWIAWRGVVLYDLDHALVGTGGFLALGGLGVVAIAIGANAQISTARDTKAFLAIARDARADDAEDAQADRRGPALRADKRKA
jgi:hypothetical protein